MKTTKRTLTALAMVALLAPAIESCKKGEEDPSISMRSRKARVAGEWNVSSYDASSTSTQTQSSGGVSETTNSTRTDTYDGTKFTSKTTYTDNDLSTTVTETEDLTMSYNFTNEGTFTSNTVG